MRLALVLVWLAILPARPTDAQTAPDAGRPEPESAPPRLELRLLGPNPSYLGQLVQLELALLRDAREQDPPAPFFAEPRVPGAIALLSTSAPPPEIMEEQGISWLVQKRRYLVFPQTEGRMQVPPLEVRVPSVGGGSEAVLRSEPVELRADVPKGTGDRAPLVARNVIVERTVEGDLDRLRVGDTFTVHVRLTAEQTDAVMLPATEMPALDGLSRYPGEAHTENHTGRGEYRAERVDSATYVADAWGRYTFPPASVFWLDPSTGRYHEAVAPALTFRARVNPSLGTGCVGGPGALGRGVAWLLVLAGAVLIARRGMRRARAARARRARVRPSREEREAFAALEKAARAGEDVATLNALYRWLRYALPGLPTLARLREAVDDDALGSTTQALESRVVASGTEGQAVDVVAPLRRLRRSVRTKGPLAALPELNHGGAGDEGVGQP